MEVLDNKGRSAADVATEFGHCPVAQWLTTYAATKDALRAAAEEPPRPPSPPPPRRPRAPRACAQCGATQFAEGGGRLHKCGGCQLGARVRYCSKACQERHWRAAHREQCVGRVQP